MISLKASSSCPSAFSACPSPSSLPPLSHFFVSCLSPSAPLSPLLSFSPVLPNPCELVAPVSYRATPSCPPTHITVLSLDLAPPTTTTISATGWLHFRRCKRRRCRLPWRRFRRQRRIAELLGAEGSDAHGAMQRVRRSVKQMEHGTRVC